MSRRLKVLVCLLAVLSAFVFLPNRSRAYGPGKLKPGGGPSSRFSVRVHDENPGLPGQLVLGGFFSEVNADIVNTDVEVWVCAYDVNGTVIHEEMMDKFASKKATHDKHHYYERVLDVPPGMYAVEMYSKILGTLEDGTPNDVKGANHRLWYTVAAAE